MNIKYSLIRFYSRYENYISALLRFGIAFLSLGYLVWYAPVMPPLNDILILLIIAAACSFLSPNFLLLAGSIYLLSQWYQHSYEAVIVGGIYLLILALFYLSFIPKQAYTLVLTAICISLQIPLLPAMACGLLMGPGACVGMLSGTLIYGISSYLLALPSWEHVLGEETVNHLLGMFPETILQPKMILMAVILMGTYIAVFLLRKLSIRNSWILAISGGLAVYTALSAAGSYSLGMEMDYLMLAANDIIGAALGMILLYFCFALDYDKTQYLQFEDDDYYYYVKAVPKLGNSGNEPTLEQEIGDYE